MQNSNTINIQGQNLNGSNQNNYGGTVGKSFVPSSNLSQFLLKKGSSGTSLHHALE